VPSFARLLIVPSVKLETYRSPTAACAEIVTSPLKIAKVSFTKVTFVLVIF
jgi:hypothetical protein